MAVAPFHMRHDWREGLLLLSSESRLLFSTVASHGITGVRAGGLLTVQAQQGMRLGRHLA